MSGGKRVTRKIDVRNWLIANGPAQAAAICRGTGLSHAAVSQAIVDIRNDPTLEYSRVPTHKDGYTHAVVYTVAEMMNDLRNQAKHLLTRSESWIVKGEKAMKIAATADEMSLAADIKSSGYQFKMQAEAILKTLNNPPSTGSTSATP